MYYFLLLCEALVVWLGAGTTIIIMSICFFIQNFQTHYCVYSGEDHVPVGVLLFSMRVRGHGGREEFSSLPPFLPHTPRRASSHAIYYSRYLHLSSSLSLFQHIFVSFVTISPVLLSDHFKTMLLVRILR